MAALLGVEVEVVVVVVVRRLVVVASTLQLHWQWRPTRGRAVLITLAGNVVPLEARALHRIHHA